MTLKRCHIAVLTVLMGLFLSLQFAGSVHAAEFGDAPHDHDEVMCVIGVVAEAADIALPPAAVSIGITQSVFTTDYADPVISVALTRPAARAPPPRAPPLT